MLDKSGGQVNPVIKTKSFGLIWPLITREVGISIVSGREDRRVDRDSVRYVKIADLALPDGLIACRTLAGRNLSKARDASTDSILPVLKTSFFEES